MSADRLREAARLMRNRAGAATQAEWWFPYLVPDSKGAKRGEWIVDSHPRFICSTHDDSAKSFADADHIASWHPAVALAVADWLEQWADHLDVQNDDITHGITPICGNCDAGNPFDHTCNTAALAVANAYMGTP
jgi:hypothetical protein